MFLRIMSIIQYSCCASMSLPLLRLQIGPLDFEDLYRKAPHLFAQNVSACNETQQDPMLHISSITSCAAEGPVKTLAKRRALSLVSSEPQQSRKRCLEKGASPFVFLGAA